jgi:hypothetical protein
MVKLEYVYFLWTWEIMEKRSNGSEECWERFLAKWAEGA